MMIPQRRPSGFNLVDSLLAIAIIEGLLRQFPRAVLTTQRAMHRIAAEVNFGRIESGASRLSIGPYPNPSTNDHNLI